MIQIELVGDRHVNGIVTLIRAFINDLKRDDVMLKERPIAEVTEDSLLHLDFSKLHLVSDVGSDLTVHWNPIEY